MKQRSKHGLDLWESGIKNRESRAEIREARVENENRELRAEKLDSRVGSLMD